MQAAADSGYKPAIQLLDEFNKKGYGTGSPSPSPQADSAQASSAFGLVYIDFSADTLKRPSDTTLVEDLKENAGEKGQSLAINPAIPDSGAAADTAPIAALREMADGGSPEAMTLLGRLHDKADGGNNNLLEATVDYLRAVRLGSPHAAQLLWELVHRPGYFATLKKDVDAKLPEAEFAWAGLVAYSFDQQLTEQQALQLLKDAAAAGDIQAMIEMGICYASGRWVRKDPAEAINWWKKASGLGSREAATQRLIAGIMERHPSRASAGDVDSLQSAALKGSVLAETALAYCYERGVGLPQDIGEAVTLYRKSARRGSRAAFDELKKLYDDLRPRDSEFAIED